MKILQYLHKFTVLARVLTTEFIWWCSHRKQLALSLNEFLFFATEHSVMLI